ncbi:MAG: hypothetical protein AAF761_04115 [Pseudomonadota bacterium]
MAQSAQHTARRLVLTDTLRVRPDHDIDMERSAYEGPVTRKPAELTPEDMGDLKASISAALTGLRG